MPVDRHVVIDLETTGLDAQLDGILEIAAVALDDGVVVGVYQQLVDPGLPIGESSQAIHGIRPADLVGAPTVASVLPAVTTFLGDRAIVAHNAPFDLAFLNRALALAGQPTLANPVFDTLEIAREVFPGERSYKLEALCKLLDRPGNTFHRALADAQALANVWPRLWGLYQQKLAWYQAQFPRIEHAALRYDQLNRLIDGLQAELADSKRLLGHYFNAHPGVGIGLPGGERLIQTTKALWDYDTAALVPLLATWGLLDKVTKLDRPRLERIMASERLGETERRAIAERRFTVGQQARLVKEPSPARPLPEPPAGVPEAPASP